jgi:Mg2+ and Co2+ transporter CorA
LDEYEKEVDSILGVFKIASVIPLEKQEEMREMKDKVNQMMTQTNAIKSALDEILEDEDDLALLNLSVLKQKPYLYSLPLVDQILILKEEMEVLLESYLMEFNTITNKLNILQQKLKSAEESVSLRLDTSRNQLLIADTCVSVISLCIALGSYVGSIFGMNLSNHVETDPAMFSHVAVFTTFAITIIAIAVLYMFKSRGILPSDMTKYDVIQKYKGGFNTVKNKVQRYI